MWLLLGDLVNGLLGGIYLRLHEVADLLIIQSTVIQVFYGGGHWYLVIYDIAVLVTRYVLLGRLGYGIILRLFGSGFTLVFASSGCFLLGCC